MDQQSNDYAPTKFGTFAGVFTPSVLTILGVIMFLREGWVVGNAGFGGAALIILMAQSVTICTGLSMSSMTTNIRIGAGGAYSIITQSLGVQVGGSIGIPLYIAQTFSAALYIIGFTEGWLSIFPNHNPQMVFTAAWALLLLVSYISADLAIKVQYIIMAVLGLSLLSFVIGKGQPATGVVAWGGFQDESFWNVYAIFFPAVTGIMAGANMSGDLKNPRRSIPLGTMSAIFVGLVIYLGMAYFLDLRASAEELRANPMVMVGMARWGWLILAGLLGATLSSALSSMVGAPRVLMALGEHRALPFASFLSRKNARGDPRNAVIVTGILIEIFLLFGTLDTIAPLLTMFFLITYGMINLVVFIEQSIGIASFRPTFRIPRAVSLFGALGCGFMMFLINPIFSIVSIVLIAVIYVSLVRRGLEAQWGDVRGGLFIALAERAARVASKYPRYAKSWKPDLLVPIKNPKTWAGPIHLIRDIVFPGGSVFSFSVQPEEQREQIGQELAGLMAPLKREGVLTSSAAVTGEDFVQGTTIIMEFMKGAFFRPNILFLAMADDAAGDAPLVEIATGARAQELGVIMLMQHPQSAFGMERVINLWLRDRSPNWHLAVLVALQLEQNWDGQINLLASAMSEEEGHTLHHFLTDLAARVRMPGNTEIHVHVGSFQEAMTAAPPADVSIFGVGQKILCEPMREQMQRTHTSCLFVQDSGMESALA